MIQLFRNFKVVLTVAILIFFVSCQKEDQSNLVNQSSNQNATVKSSHGQKFFGPTVPIGNGVARAWVEQDDSGNPTAVGIDLTEKALENLPEDDASWVLFFPNHAATHFYTHALIDWNPHGHEPAGIYDVPHFDFHFYTIPNAQRLLIGPDDTLQFANAPDSIYIPDHYWQIPGGVPQMGSHWVDLLAPEFNGGTFTRTYIWGSYDGAFIFWEPMITKAFLESQPDEVIPVRQPQAYARDGWYANDYTVSYSNRPNTYTIALTDLEYHTGQ
jgi:hypothetical protein